MLVVGDNAPAEEGVVSFLSFISAAASSHTHTLGDNSCTTWKSSFQAWKCCRIPASSLLTADFVLQVECNSKLDPTNTTFLKVHHHLALVCIVLASSSMQLSEKIKDLCCASW